MAGDAEIQMGVGNSHREVGLSEVIAAVSG
jgi:hypothetical protein